MDACMHEHVRAHTDSIGLVSYELNWIYVGRALVTHYLIQ